MYQAPNGRICWGGLLTTDPEAGADFYTAVIGWGAREWDGSETSYAACMNGEMPASIRMSDRGVRLLGGMFNRPPEMPVSARLPYIRVPDASATATKVVERGGGILNRPMEVPGGEFIAQ